jgi:hypothetical protein
MRRGLPVSLHLFCAIAYFPRIYLHSSQISRIFLDPRRIADQS